MFCACWLGNKRDTPLVFLHCVELQRNTMGMDITRQIIIDIFMDDLMFSVATFALISPYAFPTRPKHGP